VEVEDGGILGKTLGTMVGLVVDKVLGAFDG